MSTYSAILDAINRGPIQGDHIASKTDDAVDRRSALAEQLHRESQPRGSFSGDRPRLPLRSASFPDLAGDDPQRIAGGRGPERDGPDHLRQAMITAGLRPATVNRRLDALRRLSRWAQDSRTLNRDVTRDIRPVRMVRNRQPVGLTDAEVHALLRAAGASTHGLARRNYALVQLLVQAGLRIGEVSTLHLSDVVLRDR